MLDKVWKRISDKRPAGKKLIPIVLGCSAAVWLGGAAVFFYLKDKPQGLAASKPGGHGAAESHSEEEHGSRAAEEKAELAGIPATAAGPEGKEGEAKAGHGGPAGTGSGGKAHGDGAHADAEAHAAGTEAGTRAGEPAEAAEAEGPSGLAADLAEGSDQEGMPTREELAALRQVAELRAAAGQLEEAVTPMRRVMRVPTREAALLSLAARVFLGTAQYAEAYRFASELAAIDPQDMEARVWAVEARYRTGRVEEAMRAAEEALKQHPGNLPMLVELGTMQVEMGPNRKGYGEALAQALKLKPDYAPAVYLKGRKAQLEGDFKDAEAAFAKVVKLDPGNAKALGQLGMAQYHLGKPVAAENSFRAELARNPDDYNTWYNLGEVLLGRANEETSSDAVRRFRAGAMECYLKAVELNPEHAQARYRVGVLLIGNGQYKEAIRHLEAALRLDSRHVPTLVQLALAYEGLKQPERARAYLNKAYELDPLNKVILSKLRRLS